MTEAVVAENGGDRLVRFVTEVDEMVYRLNPGSRWEDEAIEEDYEGV